MPHRVILYRRRIAQQCRTPHGTLHNTQHDTHVSYQYKLCQHTDDLSSQRPHPSYILAWCECVCVCRCRCVCVVLLLSVHEHTHTRSHMLSVPRATNDMRTHTAAPVWYVTARWGEYTNKRTHRPTHTHTHTHTHTNTHIPTHTLTPPPSTTHSLVESTHITVTAQFTVTLRPQRPHRWSI